MCVKEDSRYNVNTQKKSIVFLHNGNVNGNQFFKTTVKKSEKSNIS